MRVLLVPLVHHPGHAVREFGPVRVQAAAPARGEPGEEPRLGFAGPVAGALPLAGHAVAGLLQLDVFDQVPAEGGAAGLLDVQEHHHVVPADVEADPPVQVPLREVEFGGDFGREVLVGLRLRGK